MQKKELVSIRTLDPADLGFIFATWLKGLRYANDWFAQIDHETYFERYHEIIEGILVRPKTKTLISCLKDDPDVILGYAVTEPETLHWVFVKPAWRGIGLAKDLIPKDTKTVTHLTKVGLQIKPDHIVFNPFV